MSLKTTTAKDVGERHLSGDQSLAERLADALTESGDVERYTHGFHTYPAGLHPDCARQLIVELQGERILDPFCGGGTVLVEARAAGKAAIGRDVSEVALLVSRTRSATPSEAELTRFRSLARAMTERARNADIDVNDERFLKLKDWYAPCALIELDSLRQEIRAVECESTRRQLWAAFSSILVKVSWRRSDTSAKRVKHRRPPGTTAILFHKKVRELARKQAALREAVPEGTPAAEVAQGDARKLVLNEAVDLVLTSPPYPAVYDYVPMQHLRHIWIGVDAAAGLESELGARRHWRGGRRRAIRQWTADTRAWTAQTAKQLSTGGRLVVVIGDGLTPSGRVNCVSVTEQAAKDAGLRFVARASLERPDFARQDSRWEHVFVFER